MITEENAHSSSFVYLAINWFPPNFRRQILGTVAGPAIPPADTFIATVNGEKLTMAMPRS